MTTHSRQPAASGSMPAGISSRPGGTAMTTPKQRSYSKAEKELTARLRHDLSLAKSVDDVHNFFVRSVQHLLTEISAGELTADYDDITLRPAAEQTYEFSPTLQANPLFTGLWQNSDLSAIVARMADRAANTHIHLAKHPEKTEAKMYHLDG